MLLFKTFSVYFMWKNIRWQHRNNNLKTTAPTLNDEFEFKLDESYFVLHIQDCTEYITNKHEILPTDPLNYIYINRIHKC